MKPIPGYPNYYAEENGAIHSDRPSKVHGKKMRVLKQFLNEGCGYMQLSVAQDGAKRTVRTHRLVALAFHPNPENKPQVNHIDGMKTNNAAANLEWATRSENQHHAVRTGLQRRTPSHLARCAKATHDDVDDIRALRFYGAKLKDIADIFDLQLPAISKICNRKTWRQVA